MNFTIGLTATAVEKLIADQTVKNGGAFAKQVDVTGALATKADLVGGLVPSSQIPALALHTSVPVASQAAMLALTPAQVQPGDIAVVQSNDATRGSWQLGGTGDPTVLANWTLLVSPLDAVVTVNGRQGTVVLGPADIGADPAGAAAAITLAGLGGIPKPATTGTTGQQLQIASDGSSRWTTPLAATDNGDGTASLG